MPGTLFFQTPEQETNTFELLVNVQRGSHEVEYFEDFYIDICQNDTFQLFNRPERYPIAGADRAKKKLLLEKPFEEASREQRARQGHQERRSPGRHLLARRACSTT